MNETRRPVMSAPRAGRLRHGTVLILLLFGLSPGAGIAASGRTQDQAFADALNEICFPDFFAPIAPDLGPNLLFYCEFRRVFGNVSPGSPGGDAGSATSHQSAGESAVRRRADSEQRVAEEKLENDLRLFASFAARSEERSGTALEPGLDLDTRTARVGLEKRLGNAHVGLLAGVERADGDFSNSGGGRLEIDSEHLLVYLNGGDPQRLWYTLVLGAISRDFDTLRRLRFEDVQALLVDHGVDELVPSESRSRERNLTLDLGRSFDLGDGISMALSCGLDYARRRYPGFEEQGDAPLRLAFADRRETSLIGRAGIEASIAHSTRRGVWVPRIALGWQHEFRDDAQDIFARFAEDLRSQPTAVVFSTDPPDRSSGHAEIGVSWLGARGWSAYLGYQRQIGYRHHNRDGLSLWLAREF